MRFRFTSYIIVFLIALVLCIANIWGYPITILDEAKNAEAAREMWLNNSLLPTFNGELRTDKPPLHYFFMQLGFTLFGSNEFGARFFGALLGAGLITYFYAFLNRFSTLNVTRWATFILLSAFFWIQEFHLAVPDPYLLAFLCAAWMFFYTYYKSRKTIYLIFFYLFVGLATLAKGPVAVGLSGLIVLIFLIAKKEFTLKRILSYRPILGGLLVLLIAIPWFVWIHYTTEGAFTEGFFLKHNLQRFSSEMEGHGGIFLITWGFVLLGLFPFGVFIPQGLWHGFKFRKRNDLELFSLIVGVVIIAFFSISSTKLPNYTLPAMPFLAILVAGFFEETAIYQSLNKWYNSLSLIVISLVTLAIPVAVFILFRHSLIFQYQLNFVLLFSFVGIAGLYFIWKSYIKNDLQKMLLSIGLTWVIIGGMIFYLVYPNLSKIEPVRLSSDILNENKAVVYKNYDPSFNFNYNKVYKKFDTEEGLLNYISQNPEQVVITKDKSIRNDSLIMDKFDLIFEQPSVFENYKTMILKIK